MSKNFLYRYLNYLNRVCKESAVRVLIGKHLSLSGRNVEDLPASLDFDFGLIGDRSETRKNLILHSLS